jgi:hypothetical protein
MVGSNISQKVIVRKVGFRRVMGGCLVLVEVLMGYK